MQRRAPAGSRSPLSRSGAECCDEEDETHVPPRRCRCWMWPRRRRSKASFAWACVPKRGGAAAWADAGVARAARGCGCSKARARFEAGAACAERAWGALRGPVDDTMLLSYALNPTHATQALADVAARHGQPAPASPAGGRGGDPCAGSGAACGSGKDAGDERVYREIDLPLAPVLFRMEQAGVRIDSVR